MNYSERILIVYVKQSMTKIRHAGMSNESHIIIVISDYYNI